MMIMTLNEFIENFAAQFDDTELDVFTPSTEFKSLDEWSSLIALSVIAMADEEYNVQLKGDDIKNSVTVEELFNVIMSRR